MAKLIFYNNWHNGDLHYTREFIKDIINKTHYEEYFYLHKNSPKIFNDISNLKHGLPDEHCVNDKILFRLEEDIYINTWIGASGVINKDNIPFSLKLYHLYFSHIASGLGIHLSENLDDYIPVLDYKFFNTKGIDDYLKHNNRKKILICNGDVWSYQSENFNFNIVIENLSKDFDNIDFILTDNRNKINRNNVLYANDIIKCENDDINEISYLSTFCDIIIGKSSGPYTFAIVKENVNNPNKYFIAICNNYSDATWNLTNPFKKIWINNYDEKFIYEKIKEIILKNIGEKIEDIIKKTVVDTLKKSKEVDLPTDIIETDNIGEVIEKLAILHCRMWYLEDAIGVAKSDFEIADLKRKIDICFKVKRPRYVEAINKMIEKAIREDKSLEEDSVKLYKGYQ